MLGLALQWSLVIAAVALSSVRTPHGQVPSTLPMAAIHLVVGLFVRVAVASQLTALPWLFDGRNRGTLRVILRVALVAVPVAFLCHAAWRGAGLPLPTWLALFGCGAVVVIGSSLLLEWSTVPGTFLQGPGPRAPE